MFLKRLSSWGGRRVYATTIDVSNFYWSLVMPKIFWNKFTLPGYYYRSLTFGWDFAPVIAHETLCLFLHEFFQGYPQSKVDFFTT